MSAAAFFWAAAAAVLVAASLRVYAPAAWRVLVERAGRVETAWPTAVDVLVAGVLAAWLGMQARAALASSGAQALEMRDIAQGAALYASVVILVVGIMVYRDISPVRAFGLLACRPASVVARGAIYALAACPILFVVQVAVWKASGEDGMAPQEIVRFLRDAPSLRERLAVVGMALVVAPMAEEFIFRGYLYGVAKRYLGPVTALALTSLLFAALHGHVASLPALFVLAVCLGLAYEITGSLLVPVAAHSAFNALQVGVILLWS